VSTIIAQGSKFLLREWYLAGGRNQSVKARVDEREERITENNQTGIKRTERKRRPSRRERSDEI